jgi:hypothetical protein
MAYNTADTIKIMSIIQGIKLPQSGKKNVFCILDSYYHFFFLLRKVFILDYTNALVQGCGLTKEKAEGLFTDADGNADGFVSMNELKRAVDKLKGSQDLDAVMSVVESIRIAQEGISKNN